MQDVELRAENRHSKDHAAIEETVLRPTGERYPLHAAAVDPEIAELRDTSIEPTRPNAPTDECFTELRDERDVDQVPRTTQRLSRARNTHTVLSPRVGWLRKHVSISL